MPCGNIRDSIWYNWVNETGNCGRCRAHDFGYRPRYAGGDIDSHVMIVLSDPNDGRDPEFTGLDEPKSKNESWNYGYSADNSWDMMKDYLNPLAERIEGCNDADDFYFTNAHKCPKLSGKGVNFEPRDIEALQECKEYIEDEIRAVKPDVVVALSNPAKKAVGHCSVVDFDGSKGVTRYVEEWIRNGKRFYGRNPPVVAGVHPSLQYLHLHLEDTWYGDQEHTTWYLDQLAKSVNVALDS